MHSALCELIGCNGVAEIYGQLEVCLPWVYVHSSMGKIYWGNGVAEMYG